MGRVMVTVIWSMGMTPLSTEIKIRGKLVSGNTETGMVKTRYPPSSASVMIRKMTEREWRANQYRGFSCGRSLFIAVALFRGRLFLLRRRLGTLDRHLGVIRQPITARGNYFFAFRDSRE